MPLQSVDFTLESIRASLLDLEGGAARKKGLKLAIDIPPALAGMPLQGDPSRLGQVVVNLTANALKFTAQGWVTVRARMLGESASDVRLRFEVEDSGIGISVENQKRLFTVFEQADGAMNRQHGGTGLGLALCKRLVRAMGGEIGIDSQLGVGSTFWLNVPLKKVPGAAGMRSVYRPARAKAAEAAEAVLLREYRGQRVLLVEDDAINQEIASFLLKEVGIELDIAEEGVQAISLASQNQYAAILMDLQLPGMNGLEVARAIRQLACGAGVPILAMTASVLGLDRKNCQAAGMNDFIAKPIEPTALFSTLLKWLTPPGAVPSGE